MRIRNVSREDSLRRVEKKGSTGKMTFVLKFDPRLPKVSEILHKNFKVMNRDPELREVFQNGTQVAYKRHRNFRDILVRSSLYPLQLRPIRVQPGFFKCNKCVACKSGVNKKEFYSSADGTKYKINRTITCNDCNVIYVIQCRRCIAQYVGKTINQLKDRINAHRNSIGTSSTPVALHFEQWGHSPEDFSFFAIEKVIGDIFVVGRRETLWIQRLDVIRHGINKNRTRK